MVVGVFVLPTTAALAAPFDGYSDPVQSMGEDPASRRHLRMPFIVVKTNKSSVIDDVGMAPS